MIWFCFKEVCMYMFTCSAVWVRFQSYKGWVVKPNLISLCRGRGSMIGRWVGGVHPTLVLVQVFNEWKSPRAQAPMLCYEARPSSDRSLTMEKQRGRLLHHTKEIFFHNFFFCRISHKRKGRSHLSRSEGLRRDSTTSEER